MNFRPNRTAGTSPARTPGARISGCGCRPCPNSASISTSVTTPDGWWYQLQIHLPSATEQHGRLVDEPAPVDFRAPAGRCEPIEGQAYDTVPTERHGVDPARRMEEPVYFGPQRGPARSVHRGDCRALRDLSRPATTERARAALERDDTAPCGICRPDRPLRTAAQ